MSERLKSPNTAIKCSANLSKCRNYRYSLSRIWAEGPQVLFIMLNPSTADEHIDDPTIRRCISFAYSNGFGGITVVNLFAFRSSSPKDLKLQSDPIGPENDDWIRSMSECHDVIIAAWGNHGSYMNRGDAIRDKIQNLKCLGMNKSGQPKHPLYVKGGSPLCQYK